MDEFEYDWEVLEVINDGERRGALVRYTPVDTTLPTIEKFIPIPWHKVPGADAPERTINARDLARGKIRAYHPETEWRKAKAPVIEDNSGEIATEFEREKPSGNERKRRPERGRGQTDAN